jgi:hypothetical protein
MVGLGELSVEARQWIKAMMKVPLFVSSRLYGAGIFKPIQTKISASFSVILLSVNGMVAVLASAEKLGLTWPDVIAA